MSSAVRAPQATIAIPTRDRPRYLEVALSSIAPQAQVLGVEVLVVDDRGYSREVEQLVTRLGARYLAHQAPLGLNEARNTAVQRSEGDLVVFVDDDVEVCPGWLHALLHAASTHPDVDLFAGRIRARLEGSPPRSCGREAPPITTLELHAQPDAGGLEVPFAWGANMMIRRSAFAFVGRFDPSLHVGGDEQEWQERLRAVSGRGALYVADAAVWHRRTPDDSRLPPLMKACHARGRASRRFDTFRGQAPSIGGEALTLLRCAGHVLRYRCPNGLTMVAHSAGRLREAVNVRSRDDVRNGVSGDRRDEDFLSGESGTVGGLDAVRRQIVDRVDSAVELASGRRLRLRLAASRRPPARNVLALGVQRPEREALGAALKAELLRSRHAVELHMDPPLDGRGKFENLNEMLRRYPVAGKDWLIVVDDDVQLPHGFLDRFLFLAERFSLDLAQPAHARSSHAAWRVTRRQRRSVTRETAFVEIGPVTAFASKTFAKLLPFPPLKMGWGLDSHWAALARSEGWRCGVIDALPMKHLAAPAASAYSREAAIAEAKAFLAERPYLTAAEAQRTLSAHRRW